MSIIEPEVAEVLQEDSFENRLEEEKQEAENFNQVTESDVRNATPIQTEPEIVEQEDVDEIRRSQIEEEQKELESFNEGIETEEIKEEAINLIDEINSELNANTNSLDQNEN